MPHVAILRTRLLAFVPLPLEGHPRAAPRGHHRNALNPSTMFFAALLRPLALALSVSLAALAVDAHEDILCQSALSPIEAHRAGSLRILRAATNGHSSQQILPRSHTALTQTH